MPKKKLIHFRENLAFPHLFQFRYHELQKGFPLQGIWNPAFFQNSNPIILELGCGKGEYTIGLARAYPSQNFIGMDIKGARLWRGCKTAVEENPRNVAFIRSLVDHIEKYFSADEVSEIWITFPDPQPKREKKRLTSTNFLARYKNVLKQNGIIHLKTDDNEFFDYTLDVIESSGFSLLWSTRDLYRTGTSDDVIKFQTFYEKIWLGSGRKISYLRFTMS